MFISVSSYLLCLLILSAAGLRSLSSSVLVFAVSWIVVSICFVKSPLLLREEFFVSFHISMYFGFSWSGWLGCFMLWSHLLWSGDVSLYFMLLFDWQSWFAALLCVSLYVPFGTFQCIRLVLLHQLFHQKKKSCLHF